MEYNILAQGFVGQPNHYLDKSRLWMFDGRRIDKSKNHLYWRFGIGFWIYDRRGSLFWIDHMSISEKKRQHLRTWTGKRWIVPRFLAKKIWFEAKKSGPCGFTAFDQNGWEFFFIKLLNLRQKQIWSGKFPSDANIALVVKHIRNHTVAMIRMGPSPSESVKDVGFFYPNRHLRR